MRAVTRWPRTVAVGAGHDRAAGRRAAAAAHVARRQAVEHDLLLDAGGRLGERDDHAHRHVATLEANAAAPAARSAAEERAEDVLHAEPAAATSAEEVAEVDVLVAACARTALSVAVADGAVAVVLVALRRVRQDVVGLVDLLEAVLGVRRRIHVRMQFAGTPSKRLLDLLGGGSLLDAEKTVVVLSSSGHGRVLSRNAESVR